MVSLFDKFCLDIPPHLHCHEDGLPGKRVMFITDRNETFAVSFEEGMQMMDMNIGFCESKPAVSFQCCKYGKYIHQRRIHPVQCSGSGCYAFFHIELEGDDGKTLYLPGQMTAKPNYVWSDGIEPVLMELLKGVTVFRAQER